MEAVAAPQRENRELHRSLVKETMKRKQPRFRLEKAYRIRTCVIDEMLEEAG